MRHFFFTTCLLSLSGCATTSFAPPHVNLHQTTTSLSACKPAGAAVDITPDVDGAQALIDNYLQAYTCAMEWAGDGRQAFEIPAFLSLVGSTTAIALGAGKNVAIAGGAGNSVFTAGNSYFAPGERAAILASAVDAFACIQAEAAGVDAFDKPEPPKSPGVEGAGQGVGGTVELTAERRYYDMVHSVVVTTHGIATRRLSRRGSIDAASVVHDIETLTDKINKAEQAKAEAEKPKTVMVAGRAITIAGKPTVKLELDVLQPKLEKCVVRAKA